MSSSVVSVFKIERKRNKRDTAVNKMRRKRWSGRLVGLTIWRDGGGGTRGETKAKGAGGRKKDERMLKRTCGR
jgi:hypothetical protein